MAPSGWLDIHGHFFLPSQLSPSAWESFRASFAKTDNFHIPDNALWTLDESLAHMDSVGVQMQMLSYLPSDLKTLQEANDYAASMVQKHPHRFGWLAALPTEDADACLAEIDRVLAHDRPVKPDGFAVTGCRKGVYFSHPSLLAVWKRLDGLGAVVFMHPLAYGAPVDGRPLPVIEVAFETARVATDMIYRRLLLDHSNIKIVLAHSGGALPVLSGRLELLGAEPWVPNPNHVSKEDIKEQLSRFYVDTAATAETGLAPAVKMCGKQHVVYGADCGVPCSTGNTMSVNKASVSRVSEELGFDGQFVGTNGWHLFPDAAKRAEAG